MEAASYEVRLKKAMDAVKNGHMTKYKAAKLYELNRGTLGNHLNGVNTSTVRGRPTRFNKEQEKTLANIIITLGSWCFPQTITEVLEMARLYAKKLDIKENKQSDQIWCPTSDWLLK